MLDVMIITFNEEANLPFCLEAIRGWPRRIFVIDSGSTDRTVEIAKAHGATVVEHAWEGYARQKNWGLKNLPFESEWLLLLDADELITPALKEKLIDITTQPASSVKYNGYFINRLTYFMGQPIRHCGYFPSWNMRLFKRGQGIYEDREVHEHVIINDPLAYIHEPMGHHDRRGMEHWMAKHNRYSTLEARALYQETSQGGQDREKNIPGANMAQASRTRRWLKQKMIPHLPMAGLMRFFYMYIFRMGFLDGQAGFEFCKFIAMYDSLVVLKFRELKRQINKGEIKLDALLGRPAGLAIAEGSEGTFSSRPPAANVAQSAAPAAAAVPMPGVDAAVQSPSLEFPQGDWPTRGSVRVSVLIPVKNEQANIVECIRRVLWADEIVVIDSHSTDNTIAFSQAMGAKVFQFDYSKEGWPKKKNWALENVPWQNEWVLILDADEHMTPELTREVAAVVAGNYKPRDAKHAGCGDGYWLNRRFMFMGRWIKGCGYYPSYNIRLFKHKIGRYERIGNLGDTGSGDNEVHEHIVLATGNAGYLEHDFLHYAYPDLNVWIEKHNRYSNWEALAMAQGNKGTVTASPFGQAIERRRWLKQMASDLPFRPLLRFVYSYILKRGFLDGYQGYVMSRLMAWYEFVSIAKFEEMKLKRQARDDRENHR